MIGDTYTPKRKVKYGGTSGYWGEDGINKDNEYINEEGHTGKYPYDVIRISYKKRKRTRNNTM